MSAGSWAQLLGTRKQTAALCDSHCSMFGKTWKKMFNVVYNYEWQTQEYKATLSHFKYCSSDWMPVYLSAHRAGDPYNIRLLQRAGLKSDPTPFARLLPPLLSYHKQTPPINVVHLLDLRLSVNIKKNITGWESTPATATSLFPSDSECFGAISKRGLLVPFVYKVLFFLNKSSRKKINDCLDIAFWRYLCRVLLKACLTVIG